MGKGKNWKICMVELFYCNPRLNKRVLCIRNSLCEIKQILNTEFCRKGERQKERYR